MNATVPAPAKVNLWLSVGPLQPSGFHDLDTLFCALALEDTITVRNAPKGSGIRLQVDFDAPLDRPPDLGPAEQNLAVRAAAAFAERARVRPDFDIHLLKRIPPGGGLGGGSSDAAAVLLALQQSHADAVGPDELHQIAATLGSDVPFFISGEPVARGRGRGTDLTPAPPLPPRPVVLVLPALPVATADAYRWLDEDRAAGRASPAEPSQPTSALPADWAAVMELARNDFEATIFLRYPQLRNLRDTLVRHGARPGLLAGSGSSLFGIFDDEGAASAATRAATGSGAIVVLTRIRTGSR